MYAAGENVSRSEGDPGGNSAASMSRLQNSSSTVGLAGAWANREMADMNLDAVDVTVFLVGESPVAGWSFRCLVGVMSGVVCREPVSGRWIAFGGRSSCGDDNPSALAAAVLPPNQPARLPPFGLSILPGLPSPVSGISSANLGVFLVGDGLLLPKARGKMLGKDCWRR